MYSMSYVVFSSRFCMFVPLYLYFCLYLYFVFLFVFVFVLIFVCVLCLYICAFVFVSRSGVYCVERSTIYICILCLYLSVYFTCMCISVCIFVHLYLSPVVVCTV